ncbi:MAG: SpoIVB peptidase, partial [Clostridium sp.]
MKKNRNNIVSLFLTISIFFTITLLPKELCGNIDLAFKLNKDNGYSYSEGTLKQDNLDINVSNIKNDNIALNKSIYAKTSEVKLYPGGQPLGIKLNTKGALVIALSDIQTNEGLVSPGAKAGIEIGDSILKINDEEIKNSEDVATFVNRCNGDEIKVTIKREDKVKNMKLKPVKSLDDDKYKIGLWVRDSTAGVGTLTFYDGKSKKFGALGHPITDVDTGCVMTISNGEIISSNIVSVRKGTRGNPGELRGIFVEENNTLGNIDNNTECGIFGKGNDSLMNGVYTEPLPVAKREEIKLGKAQILTTV